LKKLAFLILAVLVCFSMAAERYKDRLFDVNVERDVSFAKNVPHLSSYHKITEALLLYAKFSSDATVAYFYTEEDKVKNQDLKMDLYTPKGDTETSRPAVIVSHGGAMVAGSKDDFNQHTVNYCDSLAARGYVTASIEYRLGVTLTGSDYQLHIDSVNFARAVYRGVQDVRAAVRYMRANASKLGVDPNRIYLVGNSAGAIISLENVYASLYKDFPEYIHVKPLLGGLDDYGESAEYSTANAVAALWGAVHDPKLVETSDVPVLLVHGTADETVLFKTGRPLSNLPGTLENIIPSSLAATAASYTLDLNAPTLYGSYVIDSVLTKRGVEHETYFVEDVFHEFYDEEPYTAEVQARVFDFLYSLTQKPTGIKKPVVLARASSIHMTEGNLGFTYSGDRTVRYRVVDLRGRAVLQGNVSRGETVEFDAMDNGVYVLQVAGEKPMRFGLAK
jgi:poly(3-hydroxybutyrate) depolymerase